MCNKTWNKHRTPQLDQQRINNNITTEVEQTNPSLFNVWKPSNLFNLHLKNYNNIAINKTNQFFLRGGRVRTLLSLLTSQTTDRVSAVGKTSLRDLVNPVSSTCWVLWHACLPFADFQITLKKINQSFRNTIRL